MKIPITFSVFLAGQASDIKAGPAGSFAYSKHVDFRKSPSQLSILPGTASETGSVVDQLVTEMVQLPSGTMFAIGSTGGIYKRTTGGSWSKNATVLPDTAFGMVYNLQHDTIYIAGLNTMHSISGTDGVFSGSAVTVNTSVFSAQVDQSATDHTNTYTTPAAVSEATADTLSFTPTLDPIYSIKLWVATKGTGALTVLVHDAANNLLGSQQVAAASLANSQLNEFVFSTPIRVYLGSTYHIHVIYDNSGGKTASTLGTLTSNQFPVAQFEQWSNRFVNPTNGLHPMMEFLQYILIGNERYLAVWEPISQSAPLPGEFQQHRLVFPSGYQVTSMDIWNEFAAIAVEKRSTNTGSEFQDGRIYLWDGTASTYNTIIPVPEGSPNSLFSTKNVLYYFAGGSWWAYNGGNPVKIFQMPGTDTEYSAAGVYIRTYPHVMTVRNGILLGAYPSETNSQAIEHAVYSFGSRDKNGPESFGNSYSISTGTSNYDGTHALRIGLVKAFGDKLFISWRDDSQTQKYGVDKIDASSAPAATFSWESLITDEFIISSKRHFASPDRDKEVNEIVIVTKALPTGATITPKFKINREAAWETSASFVMQAGDTIIHYPVNKRYKELQVGFDGTAGATTPEILMVSALTETLGTEGF